MANDVTNKITIFVSSKKYSEALMKAKELEKQLSESGLPVSDILWNSPKDIAAEFDGRTFYVEDRFIFISPHGPADSLQDRICEVFSKIDKKVVIQNNATEEFNAFFQVRYSFIGSQEFPESFTFSTEMPDELKSLKQEILKAEEEDDMDLALELSEQFDEEYEMILDGLEDEALANDKIKLKLKGLRSID